MASNKPAAAPHKLRTLATTPVLSTVTNSPRNVEGRRPFRERLASLIPWLRSGRRVIALSLAYSVAQALSLPPIFLWPFTFVAVGCLVSAGILAPQSARRRETAASVLIWSALGVLPGWIFQQGWITNVTLLGGILLVISLSLATGAIPASIAALHHPRARTRTVAVWFVGAMCFFLWEMLRAHVLIGGYCWALVAQPLIDARPLSAAAAVVGESGVSFLAIAIASCAATVLVTRQRKKTLLAGGVLGLVWAGLSVLGWSPIAPTPARSIRVAILQTNVPQDNKTNASPMDEFEQWQRYEKLIATAASASPKPQLILWPETMLPGPTLEPAALVALSKEQIYFTLREPVKRDDASMTLGDQHDRIWATAYADRLLDVSAAIDVPMLVGADCLEGLRIEKSANGNIHLAYGRRFNSVYLVDQGYIRRDNSGTDRDRPVLRYDKVYLTPFGEQIPFIWRFDGFSEWFTSLVARGMRLDLSSGAGTANAHTVFEIPDTADPEQATLARVVTPICFESTIADHHRRLVFNPDGSRRADLIASVTNDGWFAGSDMQRHQHLQIVRWRAVETATPAIRAANTGISAVVDSNGRIVASGVDGQTPSHHVEGTLTRELTLGQGRTWYASVGEWPAWALAAIGAVLSVMGCLRGRTPGDAVSKA